MTPDQIERENERRRREALSRTAGMQSSAMYGGTRSTTSSYPYPQSYSGINSPHYPNAQGKLAPQAQMGTPQAGQWYYDPMAQVFINRATGQRQRNSPFVSQSTTRTTPSPNATALPAVRSAETWSGGSKVGTGARSGSGGKSGGKGKKVDPNAGKILPGLPPELQRYYEEQLSGARTDEERAVAQARTAQRSALMQAAEQRRAAGRAAATGAVDAGAALASLGLGSSPALMGAALDEVYGTGGAGMLAADAARTSALENFLRAQEEAVGTGRRRKSELEDWRALQIAALTNEDLAKLIGMSPGGKK